MSNLLHILCVSNTFIQVSHVKIYKIETTAKAKRNYYLVNYFGVKIMENFMRVFKLNQLIQEVEIRFA